MVETHIFRSDDWLPPGWLVETMTFRPEEQIFPDWEILPTSGRRICNSSWECCIFWPENWVPRCRRLEFPSRKPEFKAGRYYHLLVGRFNTICLREVLNFKLDNAILLEEDSTSGWRIGIYLAEARNFPVGTLSAMVAESIIFRAEDWLLSAWEIFSTSGLRMPFFVGMFQLPAGELELGLDRIPPSGRGMFFSIEKFQLPGGGLISA